MGRQTSGGDLLRRGGLALGLMLLLVLVARLSGMQLPGDQEEPTAPSVSVQGGEVGRVTQVIDGDTVDVRIGSETYRVRYVGVNTPERDEPCYADATAANAALVGGQVVTLVRDVSNTDQYGRLLRYVYVGDVFVNAELVEGGYAEAGYYPPDIAFTQQFETLEANARRQRLGCHASGVFQ